MKSAPPSVPSLTTLYWNDLILNKAVNLTFFGLLIAGGFYWVTRPVPGQPPIDNLSFEAMYGKYIILGGFVLSGIAATVLLLRYLRVKKIITQGTTIKGTLDDLDLRETEIDTNRPLSQGRRYKRTYFATVRYTAGGTERIKRIKLPNSGFVFGLIKGKPIDLYVLDSLPDKPLISNIYRNRK